MNDRYQEFLFYGMKPSKALKRKIQRQIQNWLWRQAPSRIALEEPSFRVCIEREKGSCICCHLEVEMGTEKWEGHDVGKSVQEALLFTLRHLTHPIAYATN